nr:capsid protein [Rat picobirnavirus]
MSRNRRGKKFRNTKQKGKYNPASEKEQDEQLKEGERVESPKYAINKESWWRSDEALLRDSAQIPFNYVLGNEIPLNNKYQKNVIVPGICSIVLQPSIGYTKTAADPLNVASQAMYAFTRSKNAGARNYDQNDLTIYVYSMTGVYQYITYLTRLYAEALAYSATNRYVPNCLIEASSNGKVNTRSITSNLANLRYGINLLINKAAAFAVPSTMPIFERAAFLYRDVFIEGTSPKNQMYLYAPAGFYQFQEHDINIDDGAGYMRVVMHKDNATVDDLIDFGHSLIDPLLNSTDIGLIYGDIIHAYGDNNTIKLASIGEVVPIVPQTDIGVLEQMHNATIVHLESVQINTDVHQSEDKSILVSTPKLSVPVDTYNGFPQWDFIYSTYEENRLLTTRTAYTDPVLVAESSRLMAILDAREVNEDTNSMEAPIYCATELAVDCKLWYFGFNHSLGTRFTSSKHWIYPTIVGLSPGVTNQDDSLTALCIASAFDFKPNIHLAVQTGPTNPVGSIGMFGSMDNLALVTTDVLKRLHETCMLSLINVTPINKM